MMLIEIDELDSQFFSHKLSIVHDTAIIDEHGSLTIEVVHDAVEFHHLATVDLGLAIAIHLGLNNVLLTVLLAIGINAPVSYTLGNIYIGIPLFTEIFTYKEFKTSVSLHYITV
jgi:hypothetical protein